MTDAGASEAEPSAAGVTDAAASEAEPSAAGVTDAGASDADRFLDIDLPHTFRGLDPEAVQDLLTDAVEALRRSQGREEELRATVAELEEALTAARAEAGAELAEAKRRGRQLVAEAQTVRRRILEDLVRRRKALRRQIEQLRVGRERLLEAYEVVGQTVEEATQELGVALPSAQAAAERAGRRLGPDTDPTPQELHAIEAEIDAARAAGLPILDLPEDAEVEADAGDAEAIGADAEDEAGSEPPTGASVEPGHPVADTGAGDEPAPGDVDEPVDGEHGAEPAAAGPDPAVDGDDGSEPAPAGSDEPVEAPVPDAAPRGAEGPEPPGAADGEDPLVLPLFDRLRAGDPEGDASPADVVDAIEAPPAEDATPPDPVAVLAEDLARRLRRALADEQNQVLDRLRQDRRGRLDLDEVLGDADARVVRLATAIEPRLREAAAESDRPAGVAGDLAARLAGAVVDGVRADVEARAARGGEATEDDEPTDLVRPVREAFRGWRTDRILPLAAGVAAEALDGGGR